MKKKPRMDSCFEKRVNFFCVIALVKAIECVDDRYLFEKRQKKQKRYMV